MNITSVPDGPFRSYSRKGLPYASLSAKSSACQPISPAGVSRAAMWSASLASGRCNADNATLAETIVLADRLAHVPAALEPAWKGHQIARTEFHRLALGRGH